MEAMTKRIFRMLSENPKLTNAELAQALNTTPKLAGIYKCRLRDKGFIQYRDKSEVKILKTLPEYPDEDKRAVMEFKSTTLQWLIAKLQEDFEATDSIRLHKDISTEIRLLLDML